MHSCPVKSTFSPLTFTTLQHTVLSPRTFQCQFWFRAHFTCFIPFLWWDRKASRVTDLVALSWGWRIVNPAHKWVQSYCHQILEHGHLAPNEPQWWIPSWKLSFANQICNRLQNRHRLLYLQATPMVSGLHNQVFYTRSWTHKVPSAASGCNLLSESCTIGLSLLWIIIIGFEFHLRLKRRSEGLKGSSSSRFDMILVVALWNQDWNHLGERGSVTCGFKHRHRLRSDNITSKQLNL